MNKQTKQNKNLSPNNQTQQNDSSQVCHILRSGRRVHTSIRVDEGLWKAFKKAVSAKGLSTCEILENLLLALTVGLSVENKRVAQPTTINVYPSFVKYVRRVRRARVEYVEEGGGVERFYCALSDEHVLVGSLPLGCCDGCPNVRCRDYVLRRVGGEFEGDYLELNKT